MCDFCEALINGQKITNHVRSTCGNDNICEYVYEDDSDNMCDLCEGCCMWFDFIGYNDGDGNIYVSIEYHQIIKKRLSKGDIYIEPFSESIQWNYCPICGEQISKDVKKFNSYCSHQIDIKTT